MKKLIMLVALTLVAGCTDLGDPVKVVDSGDENDPGGISYIDDVKPLLTRCAGCHQPSTQSWAGLVAIPAPGYGGLLRVMPGEPDSSVLMQKLIGNPDFGGRMPLAGGYLSTVEIEIIGQWIEEGALDN